MLVSFLGFDNITANLEKYSSKFGMAIPFDCCCANLLMGVDDVVHGGLGKLCESRLIIIKF